MAPVTSARAVKLVSSPCNADSIPAALTVIPELFPLSVMAAVTMTASDAAGTVRTSSFPENAADGVTPIPLEASTAETILSLTTDNGVEADALAVTSALVTV